MELDLPTKAGPESYTVSIFQSLNLLDSSFVNLAGPTDKRPVYLTRLLIARIPDDPLRRQLLEEFDRECARISIEVRDNEKRADEILKLCAVAAGEVVSYFDEFVGISRKQVISSV